MSKQGSFWGLGGISPVQFLILLQLKRQSKYGYEILKVLREQFGEVWEPKTGTIYPALRRLEARGFVKTEVKDEKEFYLLTEKGEELLRKTEDYLESGLEFADKYYRFVSRRIPPDLRDKLVEWMRERLSQQDEWPPIFLHLLLKEITDEKKGLEMLRKMKEFLQTRLILIDERIEELEEKALGKVGKGGK